MMLTLQQKKSIIFTDKEIEQYCQSVEKLLSKINERVAVQKRNKIMKGKEYYKASGKSKMLS